MTLGDKIVDTVKKVTDEIKHVPETIKEELHKKREHVTLESGKVVAKEDAELSDFPSHRPNE